MKDINEFIEKRVEKGLQSVPTDKQATERESKIMDEIAGYISDEAISHRIIDNLEDHISNLIGVFAKYAYVQGLKDGAKINQILA